MDILDQIKSVKSEIERHLLVVGMLVEAELLFSEPKDTENVYYLSASKCTFFSKTCILRAPRGAIYKDHSWDQLLEVIKTYN